MNKHTTPVILVTGSNGQLGSVIRHLSSQYQEFSFLFTGSAELNIADEHSISQFFNSNKIDACINTAAYTAVDQAENEPEKSFQVNAEGAYYLAAACKKANVLFLHLSTDYVFDGKKNTPYTETDEVSPINIYGQSKAAGEKKILELTDEHFTPCIFRVSWLYSTYGKNFVKTMLRLMKESSEIKVVNDQTGSPTYAVDLGKALLEVLKQNFTDRKKPAGGIYHFCNTGQCTWFQLAAMIAQFVKYPGEVKPVAHTEYKTLAKRSAYSVMDSSRFQNEFNYVIPSLQNALSHCLNDYFAKE